MSNITPAELVTATISGENTPDLMAAIAAKLRETEEQCRDGDIEWSDADDALLAAWRWARGEAGMGDCWEWWSMLAGNHEYEFVGESREDVLAQARENYPGEAIMIVEARYWSDEIRAEDAPFAQMRNQEMVQPEGRANG